MFGFNRASLSLALVFSASLLAACNSAAPNDGPEEPREGDTGGDLNDPTDLLPLSVCQAGALSRASYRDLGGVRGAGAARAVLVVDDEVLLATDDGLFRRPLDGSTRWERSGLDGTPVSALFSPEHHGRVLFAALAPQGRGDLTSPPIARSIDGGQTWQLFGQELLDEGRSTAEDRAFHAVSSFAVQPGAHGQGGTLFVSAGGSILARSTDNGAHWERLPGSARPDDASCIVHVAPGATGQLLRACASDGASTIATHDLSRGAFDQRGRALVVPEILGARAPLFMASSPANPSFTYVGVEGGLIRVEGQRWGWIWKSSRFDANRLPDADITAAWADPCDPMHVVMSGTSDDTGAPLHVFETFDGGRSVKKAAPPRFLSGRSYAVAGSATAGDDFEEMVIALTNEHAGELRASVVVRTHEQPAVRE